MSYRDQTS